MRHRTSKHGHLHVAIFYVAGVTCRCCFRIFHARNNVLRHLKTAKRCLPNLQHYYALSSIGIAIGKKRVGTTDAADHKIGYLQMQGPCNTGFGMKQIRDGRVIGQIVGPPFETRSVARFRPDGPPLLRTVAWPWCQTGCPFKQPRQVDDRNALFCALLFAAELLVVGGFAIVDHPSYLDLHTMFGAPSIRLPPIVRAFLLHPDAEQCHLRLLPASARPHRRSSRVVQPSNSGVFLSGPCYDVAEAMLYYVPNDPYVHLDFGNDYRYAGL